MSDQLFDARRHTFGIPEIEKHICVLSADRQETVGAQRRLLRKWAANRDKLHAFTRKSHDEVCEYQLERISELADLAYSGHPFYRKLYSSVGFRKGDIVSWDDYHALPTVTKKDIIDNYHLFTDHLFPPASECYTPRTSGSSGMALTSIFDPAALDKDLMQCLRFADQMLGRHRAPDEWLYQVYLACLPITSLDGKYPSFTVSNECPPEAIVEHLKRLKPAILSGLPAALMRIGALVKDPEELGIRAVNTNSEPSTPMERALLSKYFGAPVFDEYSSVELCLIATQCAHGAYHLVEDNVRVDVINPGTSGLGEIVATNLHNTHMPFIRYRHGDQIAVCEQESTCECGSRMRELSSFMGRSDQFLTSRTRGAIPPDLVMALYDRTLLTAGARIKEFQIIQSSLDSVVAYVVPLTEDSGRGNRAVEEFKVGMVELFADPSCRIEVRVVDQVPPSTSRKRRLIENRIGSQP